MSDFRIQWYPGHMARTRRKLGEALSAVDVAVELLDARIPRSSRNPDIDQLVGDKPRVIILNRADQADAQLTDRWTDTLSQGSIVIRTDAKSGRGVDEFSSAVKRAGAVRLEQLADKGRNEKLRVMVVGVPNVGKSSLINRILGGARARAEDRPGVTRTNQWFYIEGGLELLDTPGMLWPRFDDPEIGLNLAFTGAIRDEVVDVEGLAARLAARLAGVARDKLETRYGIDVAEAEGRAFETPEGGSTLGAELLEDIGRRRGCLISGGEVDFTRAGNLLLDEFRAAKIGRITLEEPNANA